MQYCPPGATEIQTVSLRLYTCPFVQDVNAIGILAHIWLDAKMCINASSECLVPCKMSIRLSIAD